MTHLDMTLAPAVTAVAGATIKATALLVMAFVLARILRHRAAALRHLVWTVALGSAVALLALPVALPAWRVMPVSATLPVIVRPAVRSDVQMSMLHTTTVRRERQSGGAPAGESQRTTPNRPGWPTIVFGLWLAGLLAIATRYAWSRFALERLARGSVVLAERSVFDQEVFREMRIARPVCLRTSDDVDLPLTWGIVHPQIVLPGDAIEWTPERRRHVLQHELAHIKRLDAATQLVAHAASALFWFNPLVWFAAAQMRRERERACDDCVLAGGAVASAYASDLLALVTSHGYADRHPVALAFARRSHFEGRLLALLDPTLDRGFLSPRVVAVVVSIALALVAPLAAVRSAAARPVRPVPARTLPLENQQRDTALTRRSLPSLALRESSAASSVTSTQPIPMQPVAVEALPTERAAAAAAGDLFSTCTSAARSGGSDHDSHSSSNDNGTRVWTASGEFGGCSFDLRSEGDITFNADATSIEEISDGGYFEATTNIHGDITMFSARRGANGALSFQLSKRGEHADGVMSSAVWLQQFLIGLDRTTAFAVDRRFPVLLQAGGPANVLTEVEQMYTDHARYVYSERLLRSANLDPVALRRMSAVASSMSVNHSSGELIVAIADHYPLSDPVVRAALLATALAMSVTHEEAMSILSIVKNATLSGNETMAVLESITKMNVDAEKARALLAVAASQRLDGDLRTAYTSAAESIRQPNQRDRVMAAIR